jgi:hypothetical protein
VIELEGMFSMKLCYSDRIEEADVDVQTDAFLDRPPSPLFIPQSTGKDVSTQIEDGDVSEFLFVVVFSSTVEL